MNITYLFGNGFDVNLGLLTRYTDYYPKYMESIESILNTNNPNELNPSEKSIRGFWKQMPDDYKDWADFENAIALYAKGDETDIKAILSDFTNKFSDYLHEVANSAECNEECADGFIDFIMYGQFNLKGEDRTLMLPYRIKYGTDNHIINLITFNYTDTLERILEFTTEKYENNIIDQKKRGDGSYYTAQIKTPILHIHGTLEDGDSVIIGIDSIDQFADENLKGNDLTEKYCVKTRINKDIGFASREKQFSDTILKSDVIYTFGVSFGETDKSRWKVILDWLNISKSHKLVVYYYDSKISEIKSTYARDLLDYIDEIKREVMYRIGIHDAFFGKYHEQIFIIDSTTVMKSKFFGKVPIPSEHLCNCEPLFDENKDLIIIS